MKKTLYLLIACAIVACGPVVEQSKLKNIAEMLKRDQVDSAKTAIDDYFATTMDEIGAEAQYYKGFTYKAYYNESESDNVTSMARFEAVEAFQACIELSPDSLMHASALKSIVFLASTMYNDAASNIDRKGYVAAQDNFTLFCDLMTYMYPDSNLSKYVQDFQLAMAANYMNMYKEEVKNVSHKQNAILGYETVIELDALNKAANYNLALIYYNEAVERIKIIADCETLDDVAAEVDLTDSNARIPSLARLLECFVSLESEQEEVLGMFNKALPYFESVRQSDPQDENSRIGLTGIYFAQKEYEKQIEVQAEIDALYQ